MRERGERRRRSGGRTGAKGRWVLVAIGFGGLAMILSAGAWQASPGEPENLPVAKTWSGNYPVSRLDSLPAGQRSSAAGFIGDPAAFADVWKAFKPGEDVPEVDFVKSLVVFARNVEFYNTMSLFKVVLRDGVAEVLTIETRTSRPVADKVAIVLAVIPRDRVKFIKAGAERIPVAPGDPLAGPRSSSRS